MNLRKFARELRGSFYDDLYYLGDGYEPNIWVFRSLILESGSRKKRARGDYEIMYGNLLSTATFLFGTVMLIISVALWQAGVVDPMIMSWLMLASSIVVLLATPLVWGQFLEKKLLMVEDVFDKKVKGNIVGSLIFSAVTLICILPVGYGAVIYGIMQEAGLGANLGLWEGAAAVGAMTAFFAIVLSGLAYKILDGNSLVQRLYTPLVIATFLSTMLMDVTIKTNSFNLAFSLVGGAAMTAIIATVLSFLIGSVIYSYTASRLSS